MFLKWVNTPASRDCRRRLSDGRGPAWPPHVPPSMRSAGAPAEEERRPAQRVLRVGDALGTAVPASVFHRPAFRRTKGLSPPQLHKFTSSLPVPENGVRIKCGSEESAAGSLSARPTLQHCPGPSLLEAGAAGRQSSGPSGRVHAEPWH